MDRITTLGSTTAMRDVIAASQERLAEAQEQIATGVRFTRSSEDPSDAAAYLRNQRSLDRMAQLSRNSSNARLWLDTTDTALRDAVDSATRARTLGVQGANDVNSPEARSAIAANLRSIADEMISLSNTVVNGRPIFAGTADTARAYDASGNYQGDTGQVVRAVTPNDSFTVAANGPAVFGVPNGADPYNGTIFQAINEMADAVEAGDADRVRAGIEAMDAATSRIQAETGRVGGLAARLDEIDARNQASQIATQSQISDVRDVDMAEAILRLKSAETSYEATLSAAGRSLSRSLLDFLR
jgi:flagellar hook-associated protein 3 FlgL